MRSCSRPTSTPMKSGFLQSRRSVCHCAFSLYCIRRLGRKEEGGVIVGGLTHEFLEECFLIGAALPDKGEVVRFIHLHRGSSGGSLDCSLNKNPSLNASWSVTRCRENPFGIVALGYLAKQLVEKIETAAVR